MKFTSHILTVLPKIYLKIKFPTELQIKFTKYYVIELEDETSYKKLIQTQIIKQDKINKIDEQDGHCKNHADFQALAKGRFDYKM